MKFVTVVKNYVDNSSFHGLRYLTQKERSRIERLFWLISVIAAFYWTYQLSRSSYEAYRNKAISFTVATDYLHWNTSFPSIALCEMETYYMDTVYEYVKREHPSKVDDIEFQSFVDNVAFFTGHCEECKNNCNKKSEICDFDLKNLTKHVHTPCEIFFKECKWNGQSFNCCSKVTEIESERGLCLSLNNINLNWMPPVMTSNKYTGPGTLDLTFTHPVELFILSGYDVPYHNIPTEQTLEIKYPDTCNIILNVFEIDNDDALYFEQIDRRGCRFPNENPLNLFQHYSYSTCISECRAKYQAHICNCTYHMLPQIPGYSQCKADGLKCIYDQRELFILKASSNTAADGIMCPCASSCVESEYNIIYKECSQSPEDTVYRVSVKMASLPYQRFKRNLIRSKLELVISLGSAAALFLGASLLSVVELIMYCCVRPFINVTEMRE